MGTTASKVIKCLVSWWWCRELADHIRETKGVVLDLPPPNGGIQDLPMTQLEQALLSPAVAEACVPQSVLLGMINEKQPPAVGGPPKIEFGTNHVHARGLSESCVDALVEAINTAAAVEPGPTAVKATGSSLNVTGLSDEQMSGLSGGRW